MDQYAQLIIKALSEFNPEVVIASTGSIYIYLTGSKVKEIRVSNHKGHRAKRNVWELRTDAMTTRGKNNNRIYNATALKVLIADFK